MNEPVEPLERRYRRLLRLLPADHRAARGEELLGLLLDLDAGRTRPSLRQGVGVLGLVLWLRLPGTAALLLTAFLVAYTTETAAAAYRIGAGLVTVAVADGYPIRDVTLAMLIPALLRLAIAVAWILGARRTTMAACAALLAWTGAVMGGPLVLDLAVCVALGATAAWWWPTRRPRAVLLATIPLAMLLWTLLAAWNVRLGLGLLSVVAAVALAGAVSGRWPAGAGPAEPPRAPVR